MDVTEAAARELDRPEPFGAPSDPDAPLYRRALIPLDGSDVAEAILPFFLRIAGPLDLELVLVRVVQRAQQPQLTETPPLSLADALEEHRRHAEEYVRAVADRVSARGLRVRTSVRIGEPALEIVEEARDCQADLIAMTTHGRGGLGRFLFGSVAETVLRGAHVPVFLMRMTDAELARRAA